MRFDRAEPGMQSDKGLRIKVSDGFCIYRRVLLFFSREARYDWTYVIVEKKKEIVFLCLLIKLIQFLETASS